MILNAAEARVLLGLAASVSDDDRAIIQLLLPMVGGAIKRVLRYDPERKQRVEWYPRLEKSAGIAGGVWDSNQAGTQAFFQSTDRNTCLQLAHIPVRSIQEIKVDYEGGFGQKSGTFGDSTILTAGEDYYQDAISGVGENLCNATGHVFNYTGWPAEPGTVKITYTAGYTPDELAGQAIVDGIASDIDASPIKHAAILTLAKAFSTIKARQKTGIAGMAGFTSGNITSETLGAYSYATDGASAAAITGMVVSVPPEAEEILGPFVHFGIPLL
jgi:hypothetical protein